MLTLDRNIYNSIMVLGPTASGKTQYAAQLAYQIGGCILSADSRQVYKHLDIGTGKDLKEYHINGVHIPHRLIDIVELGDSYNLSNYIHDFEQAWNDCGSMDLFPIICGGTGLYLDAVLKGHSFAHIPINENLRKELEVINREELLHYFHSLPNSQFHALADLSTNKRTIRAIEIVSFLQNNDIAERQAVEVKPYIIGMKQSVEQRREKIRIRLQNRLQTGLVEEVEWLIQQGLSQDYLMRLGLEYKYITLYINGTLSYSEMQEQLYNHICRFAKRQMTWFRKMEREGYIINWIE